MKKATIFLFLAALTFGCKTPAPILPDPETLFPDRPDGGVIVIDGDTIPTGYGKTIDDLTRMLSIGDSVDILTIDGETGAKTWKKFYASVLQRYVMDSLSTIGDVTISGVSSGQGITWNGSAWVNTTLADVTTAQLADSTAAVRSDFPAESIVDSTRLVQDSVLVYYQGGAEVGRDTISVTGSAGGSGTDDQTAAEVPITDAGGFYTGAQVEAALQEIGSDIASIGGGAIRDTFQANESNFVDKYYPTIAEVESYISGRSITNGVVSYSPPIQPIYNQVRRIAGGFDHETDVNKDYAAFPVITQDSNYIYTIYHSGPSHSFGSGTVIARTPDKFVTIEKYTVAELTVPGVNDEAISPMGVYIYQDTIYVPYRYYTLDPPGSTTVVSTTLLYKKSGDAGETWSDSTIIPNPFDSVGVISEMEHLVIRDTLIMPSYGQDSTENFHVRVCYASPGTPESYTSIDMPILGIVSETGIVQSGDSLVMFGRYTNTQIVRASTSSASLTDWSNWEVIDIPDGLTVAHPKVRRLGNNWLVMGVRFALEEGAGIIVSKDEGRTWEQLKKVDYTGNQEYVDFVNISQNEALMVYGIEDPPPVGAAASQLKAIKIVTPTEYIWEVKNSEIELVKNSSGGGYNEAYLQQQVEDFKPLLVNGYGFSDDDNTYIQSDTADHLVITTGGETGLYQSKHNANISKVGIGKSPGDFALDLSAFDGVNFLPMRIPAATGSSPADPTEGAFLYSRTYNTAMVGTGTAWKILDQLNSGQIGYGGSDNVQTGSTNFTLVTSSPTAGTRTLNLWASRFTSGFVMESVGANSNLYMRQPRIDISSYRDAKAGSLIFQKSRGADQLGTFQSLISSTDSLMPYGTVGAQGYNNAGWRDIAKIDFSGDGVIGGTYVSGKMVFSTSNGSTLASEKMRIDGSGVSISSILDISTGLTINDAATDGNYLRGNGTNFVSSAIQAADIPEPLSGSGPPAVAPRANGDRYFDYTNSKWYSAWDNEDGDGTGDGLDADDWVILN